MKKIKKYYTKLYLILYSGYLQRREFYVLRSIIFYYLSINGYAGSICYWNIGIYLFYPTTDSPLYNASSTNTFPG